MTVYILLFLKVRNVYTKYYKMKKIDDEVLQYLMDLIFNGFGVQIPASTTGFQTTDFSMNKVF